MKKLLSLFVKMDFVITCPHVLIWIVNYDLTFLNFNFNYLNVLTLSLQHVFWLIGLHLILFNFCHFGFHQISLHFTSCILENNKISTPLEAKFSKKVVNNGHLLTQFYWMVYFLEDCEIVKAIRKLFHAEMTKF
jgi:hypothetical protein